MELGVWRKILFLYASWGWLRPLRMTMWRWWRETSSTCLKSMMILSKTLRKTPCFPTQAQDNPPSSTLKLSTWTGRELLTMGSWILVNFPWNSRLNITLTASKKDSNTNSKRNSSSTWRSFLSISRSQQLRKLLLRSPLRRIRTNKSHQSRRC